MRYKSNYALYDVISRVALYVILLVFSFSMLFPYWFMFIAGFRTNSQVYSTHFVLIPENGFLQFENFIKLYSTGFFRCIWNTFFVSFTKTSIGLFLCAMAGFAFSKFTFPGKNILFYTLLITMMVPFQVAIIPNYLLMTKFGWINNYSALIIPGIVGAFGIFLMRQYMGAIPNEVLDSGKMDGCSDWGLLLKIVIPMIQGGLVVLGIISFMGTWNDFFWPLIVISDDKLYTVTLKLASFTGMYYFVQYGTILAGAFISSLPMIALFLVFKEKMLTGILAGAIK